MRLWLREGAGAGQRAGLPSRDARGKEGEERGPVTRVVLVAKGGIHGPQRERRARAGPALHRPPLITFSGPLPAGTDNAGGAFEVPKGCRGGSLSTLLPAPRPPEGGGQQDKTRSQPQPARKRETKGKQTGLEPGARCRVCPPPRRARMMDGCSQPARLPGRPRYLHNTGVPPVTSDTALPGA